MNKKSEKTQQYLTTNLGLIIHSFLALGIYTSVAYDRGIIGATAFFAFAAIAAYAADLFFRFQEWRSDGGALPWKNTQNSNQQNVGDGPKTVEV